MSTFCEACGKPEFLTYCDFPEENDMAIIALMGGSFNPITEAHLAGAHEAKTLLHCDRLELMFSENPLKDPAVYAPLQDRMEMTRIRLSFHPEYDFDLADEEGRLGTHISFEVLSALKKEHPENTYIWVMGSDNLATFEGWHNKEELLENFPIVVVRRESKPEEIAKEKEFQATYAHLRRNSVGEALEKGGWYVMDNNLIPGSSTDFRTALKSGASFSNPADQAVADYARAKGFYGLTPPAALPARSPPQHPNPL
jgi:nicotinate-nucleotide adenylyltransferase